MALSTATGASAQSNIMINHHIITNYCSSSDYHSHAMIDKKSSTNLGRWVNLNASYSSNPI
jgi:hypothetical protein